MPDFPPPSFSPAHPNANQDVLITATDNSEECFIYPLASSVVRSGSDVVLTIETGIPFTLLHCGISTETFSIGKLPQGSYDITVQTHHMPWVISEHSLVGTLAIEVAAAPDTDPVPSLSWQRLGIAMALVAVAGLGKLLTNKRDVVAF
ncbi:MAG TPA: hypothetical protein VF132_09520 [Rudaea sp.]